MRLLLPALLIATGLAATASAQASSEEERRWNIFGDFRVRYEYNSEFLDIPERHRGVLRFRLGGLYEINKVLHVGARVVTGDPDNPRTADVTIGDFLNDLEFSLDQAYLAMNLKDFSALAGKFPNPMLTTELVWDGDVNPAGITGTWSSPSLGTVTPRFAGLFMIVDEQTIEEDSYMWGGQFQLGSRDHSTWGIRGGVSYLDYTIGNLKNATAADLRGNNLTPDGSSYLSDFNLLDVVLSVYFTAFGERYPIFIDGDFVRNLGAAVDEDTGYSVNVVVGRSWEKDHFAFRYHFGRCETDAVFAMFSNDNLPIQTNYLSNTFAAGYGVLPNTTLSLTWYLFKQLVPDQPTLYDDDGFSSRIRLDLMVRF